MDASLASARHDIFFGAGLTERATALRAIQSSLNALSFEQITHVLLDWPSAVDDLSAVLSVALRLGADAMASAAITSLGHIFCVGLRPKDLDFLLEVATAHARLAPAVLQAIEDAAKSRNMRSKPCSFWALRGLCEVAPTSPRHRAAEGVAGPSVSSFLSLSWERWPFPREYALWTMVRVSSFGSGSGENKSTLLRALAGNGARLHIWLEHKALHITVQEPPSTSIPPPPNSTGAAAGASSLLSAVRDRITATASAAAERLGGVLPGSPVANAASPSNAGISTTTISCPSLVAGEWIAIALHHIRRRGGILGGGQEHHEVSVSIDGHEVAHSVPCAFPRSLGAAPLVLARLGEALSGEIGPLYMFGEGSGPVPPPVLAALERAHTGGTVNLLPTTTVAVGPESYITKAFAVYHPAFCRRPDLGDDTMRENVPLFYSPSLLGSAPTYVSGHHAIHAVAGVGVRDVLQAVGGVVRMLPLLRGVMASKIAACSQKAFRYPISFCVSEDVRASHEADSVPVAGSSLPLAPREDGVLERSIVSQVLDACAALLRDHLPNCQQALHHGFFTALRLEIAPFLRPPVLVDPPRSGGMRPAHDDENVISAVFALASAATIVPELKIDAWKTFICWAPLYAYAAANIQQQLFSQLRRVARAQPTLFRAEIGITFLVDALKTWYSAVCNPTAAMQIYNDTLPEVPQPTTHAEHGRSDGAPSLLPYVVRHELLREYLRFIGCAMLAAPAVLHPSEFQTSAGIAAAMRRHTSNTSDRLRRRDVDPLLQLLNADVDSLPRGATPANMPSPLELLRAEVCNLLSALLDYDCSHVEPSSADAVLHCADVHKPTTPTAATSQGGSPLPIDSGQVSILVAHSSCAGQILPLLDAASKNNFASMVLFGVLPQVGCLVRACAPAAHISLELQCASAGSLASGLRLLGQALRADGGRLSRFVSGDLSSSAQPRSYLVTEKSKLASVIGQLASRAESKSGVLPLAALSGAVWSREFQAQRGFDILFQIFKMGPIIGPLIYPALIDLCFLPDAATSLVAGSLEETGGADGKDDDADHARRAIGLECSIARVVGRSNGGSGWFLSALDPPPHVNVLQCGLQSVGTIGLILRLIPHMRASTVARALGDILTITKSPENATAIVLHLQDWGPLLFRALMFLTPIRFPGHADILHILTDVTPAMPDLASPIPAKAGNTTTPFAVGPSDAAQVAVDDAYASGEAVVAALARAALHVHNGWRAYQRLLSLQPMMRYSAADIESSSGSRASNVSEWSVPPQFLSRRVQQGRRLVALAMAAALREASAARRSRLVIENLLALTAMLDREFTVRWPSGTRWSRRVGAATPGDGMRARGGSSQSLSILARSKDVVLRTMSSQLPRRPPSTVEGGVGTSKSGRVVSTDLDGSTASTPSTPVDLGADDGTKNAVAAQEPPPPLRFSVEPVPPDSCASADEPDPEMRFDGSLAHLVLVAWDDLLVPSPDEAERFLAMTCEALPLSGSLLHMLTSLSLWTLQAYPVDHPAIMAALARMQRLQLVLFSDLRMTVKSPALESALSPAVLPSSSSSLPTPIADSKPPRSGKPPSGREGSAVSVPTRIASFLQSGRDRGGSVVSTSGGEDDWEEVHQMGRPGISLDTWLLFVITRLHALFKRLRDDVIAVKATKAQNTLSTRFMESHTAVAELGIALLKDLVQLGGGQTAAAADSSMQSCKEFLNGYEQSLAASNKSKWTARKTDPVHEDLHLDGGQPLFQFDPWEWLVGPQGDMEPSQHSSSALVDFAVEESPVLPLSKSLALPNDRSTSIWIVKPAWNASVAEALDSVYSALEQAVEEIDDAMVAQWQLTMNALREDSGLLEPIHRELLAQRKAQLERRASKASSTLSSESASGGVPQSPQPTFPTQGLDATRESNVTLGVGSVVASAATSAAAAVSVAAAGIGRSAFKRITDAGNQVKKGIANIAALATGFVDTISDNFPPEGEPLPRDLQDLSENRLHWVPASVLNDLSPFRAYRPPWFVAHWRALMVEGEHCIHELSLVDIMHRIRLSTTLADIEQCSVVLRKRNVKRILTDDCSRTIFVNGDCTWRFPSTHLKLLLRIDAYGRRLRMTYDFAPRDFSGAAYKAGEHAIKPALVQKAPSATLSRNALEDTSSGDKSKINATDDTLLTSLATDLSSMASVAKAVAAAAATSLRTQGDEDVGIEDESLPSGTATPHNETATGLLRDFAKRPTAEPPPCTAAPASVPLSPALLIPASIPGPLTFRDTEEDVDILRLSDGPVATTATGAVTPFAHTHGERDVIFLPAKMIMPDSVLQGTFVVTTRHLLFEPDFDVDEATVDSIDFTRHYKHRVHCHGTVPAFAADTLPNGLSDYECAGDDKSHAKMRRPSVSYAASPAPPRRRVSVDSSSSHSAVRDQPSCKPRRWQLNYLVRVLPRRYLLQRCALEFFFLDKSSVFVAFATSRLRAVWDAIWAQRPIRLVDSIKSLKPADHLKAWGVQERWRRRELSNFDYLMALNFCAGRSFNDLTQYPIMPWVIADYTSQTLDINDPRTFRDLSKPVGALNSKRLAAFRERMEALRGGDIKPFLYGSHYSNAGFVLYYLLRIQPFTRMALSLQGGNFDCPDRLFFSVSDTWHGVTHSMSDVKELIPEWYTTPAMFKNSQGLPLGQMQDGAGFVDDVRLPPWAKSAEEFVWLNRMALESEYVSANLHLWIDLIFGAKQQGPAADVADNVFYFLTYESECTLDQVSDPIIQQSMVQQIAHFGQTPVQLFRRAHPARLPVAQCAVPMLSSSVGVLQTLHTDDLSAGYLLHESVQSRTTSKVATCPSWTELPIISLPCVRHIDSSGMTTNLGVFTALYHPVTGPTALSAQLTLRNSISANALATAATAAGSSAALVATAGTTLSRDKDSGAIAAARPCILAGGSAMCARDQQMAFIASVGGSRLLCVHADATFALHRWSPLLTESGLPFEIKSDKPRPLAASAIFCGSNVASSRPPGLPSNQCSALLYDAPPDATASSTCLAALAGASQAIAPSSCFALVSGLSDGAPVPGVFGGTAQRPSASGALTDAILFSSGYIDGSLRWQLLPAVRGRSSGAAWDSWDSRAAGGGDVTCVAAGEGDSCALVTGHGNGQVRLWFVVRQSVALAQAISSSWSEIGYHNLAHFPGSSSSAAVHIALGEHTDYSCVQQVCTSLRLGAVTSVALSTEMGLVIAGLGNGTIGIISSRDGRIHRLVPYPTPSLNVPGLAMPKLGYNNCGLDLWQEAIRAEKAKTARPRCHPALPAVKHVTLLSTGYVFVHWARQLDQNSLCTESVGLDGSMRPLLSQAAVASELGLLHINGEMQRHLRLATNGTGAANLSAQVSSHAAPHSAGSPSRTRHSQGFDLSAQVPTTITAVEAAPDGSVVVVGASTGELLFLHGLTLGVLGHVTVHQEVSDAVAAAQRAAESALAMATFAAAAAAATAAAAAANDRQPSLSSASATASSTAANLSAGLRASFASAFGSRKASSKAPPGSSIARSDIAMSSNVGGNTGDVVVPGESGASDGLLHTVAPALSGTTVSLVPAGAGAGITATNRAHVSIHAAAGITCLRFTDDFRSLLVGCGDGRLCVVTDMAVAQRTLASTLQSGLFGLV